MPSIIGGLVAGLVVFVAGIRPIREDRMENMRSKDMGLRLRWVWMLGVLIAVSSMLSEFVREQMYRFSMISLNKQHFANVHWLALYKKALS